MYRKAKLSKEGKSEGEEEDAWNLSEGVGWEKEEWASSHMQR